MAGFITMAQALQIIGQAPVKHGSKTATEKLRAAKSTFPMFGGGGGMGDMLQKMMTNGPGALLSNPMGAISGALGGQLSGITGQLNGMIAGGAGNIGGLTSLVSQISGAGGLQSALTQLSGTSAALSGLPGIGQFDLQSVMGHAGLGSLGVSLPAAVGLDKVLGPVFSQGLLGNMQSTLGGMAQQVIGGADPSAMIERVGQYTVQALGVITDSSNALLSGQNLTLAAAHLSVVSDAVREAQPGIMSDFMNAIINPDGRQMIDTHNAAVEAMFNKAKAPEPEGGTNV